MAKAIRRIVALTTVTAVFLVAWQYQALADWWFLYNYEPSEEIAELSDNSYLSDAGRRAFYVADPEINDKQEFNRNCPVAEESFVLGCYNDARIYVLQVDRAELDGIMEVTAAHEMLHSVYDRMDGSERSRINRLLEETYSDLDNDRIRELIATYEQEGGAEVRRNELHSLLATQVEDLPRELDDYYDEYFSDRQAVVDIYQGYESVFIDLHEKIENYQEEITDVRSQLETLEADIDYWLSRVQTLNNRLDRLEAADDIQGYNRVVPEQNQAVDEYNSLVDRYRSLINRHNSLVNEVNRLVLLQNDLVNSMDSSFEPL